MPRASLKIAITGGTGFVGRYVIEAALSEGHCVRALIRNPAKRFKDHENLEWFLGSLGADDEVFVSGMDVVIHIAGLVKARTRQAFFDVNEARAADLAEAAGRAGVPRVLLISSQTAGQPDLSDYAASKRAGEEAVREAFKGGLTIIRAPAVFGPGDTATAPFFAFIRRGHLPVPGGKDWRARRVGMVYAPDLAAEILRAATRDNYDGKVYTPATLPDISWPEFAKLWSNVLGRDVKPVPLPPALHFPIAAVTSLTSRLFGAGHFTLGKRREFMHRDWSADHPIVDATDPAEALAQTYAFYNPDRPAVATGTDV